MRLLFDEAKRLEAVTKPLSAPLATHSGKHQHRNAHASFHIANRLE